jgi:hypothetical protein
MQKLQQTSVLGEPPKKSGATTQPSCRGADMFPQFVQ